MPWDVEVYLPGSACTDEDFLGMNTVKSAVELVNFINSTLKENKIDKKITINIIRNYTSEFYQACRPKIIEKYKWIKLKRIYV